MTIRHWIAALGTCLLSMVYVACSGKMGTMGNVGARAVVVSNNVSGNGCPALSSYNNTSKDVSAVLQRCIDQTPVGGTLALDPGVYTVRSQIQIKQGITLMTQGKSPADPKCDYTNSAGCAEIKASFGFTLPGGTFPNGGGPIPDGSTNAGIVNVLASAAGTTIDHIVVNGDRMNRVGSPAEAACIQLITNLYGINMAINASNVTLTNSVIKNSVCGRGMGTYGVLTSGGSYIALSHVVVSNNTFAFNGVHDRQNLWSDGFGFLELTDSTITNNEGIDNTDIDMIFGGCHNCVIQNNYIHHTGAFPGSSFAAFHINIWDGAKTTGAFYGTHVSNNRIDCSTSKSCGFGFLIGADPWSSAVDPTHLPTGGAYHDNSVTNAQQGFTISSAHDLSIYNNVVTDSGGDFAASCGVRTAGAYNISAFSWNVDRSKDNPAIVYTNVDWTNCILNWWQRPPPSGGKP